MNQDEQFDIGETVFLLALFLTGANFFFSIWAINPLLTDLADITLPGPIALLIGGTMMFWLLFAWAEAGFSGRSSMVIGSAIPLAAMHGWQAWGASPTAALGIALSPAVIFLGWRLLPDPR